VAIKAAYRVHALQLQARCAAAKVEKPKKRFIVGTAMDACGVRGSSSE
jgi:hypothetical protein